MRTSSEALASYEMEEVPLSARDGRQVATLCALAEGSASLTLSVDTKEVAERLSADISRRVEPARVTVLESQVVPIAYAPELAQAPLRRQQAAAIVAARQQIVEGAVGMVELAFQRLAEGNVVELDVGRKAAMVSNFLVVLCCDHPTEPIVNAGSLYH
jgi:hypothetical protein